MIRLRRIVSVDGSVHDCCVGLEDAIGQTRMVASWEEQRRPEQQARKTAENAETAAYSAPVDAAFPDDLSDLLVWTALAEDAAVPDTSE